MQKNAHILLTNWRTRGKKTHISVGFKSPSPKWMRERVSSKKVKYLLVSRVENVFKELEHVSIDVLFRRAAPEIEKMQWNHRKQCARYVTTKTKWSEEGRNKPNNNNNNKKRNALSLATHSSCSMHNTAQQISFDATELSYRTSPCALNPWFLFLHLLLICFFSVIIVYLFRRCFVLHCRLTISLLVIFYFPLQYQ